MHREGALLCVCVFVCVCVWAFFSLRAGSLTSVALYRQARERKCHGEIGCVQLLFFVL